MRYLLYATKGALLALLPYSAVYMDDYGEALQISIGTIFFIFSLPWNFLVAGICSYIPDPIIFKFLGREGNDLFLWAGYYYIGTVFGTFINGFLISWGLIPRYLRR